MVIHTSRDMRANPLFMRSQFESCGKWGIPLVKKDRINLNEVRLIACSDTRTKDSEKNKQCGVHFFVDDYRFDGIYKNPQRTLNKFSQYAFLLTPDYLTYVEMNPWRQIESVAHSRWCGAYWQSQGLKVIPSITWSTPSSYNYCFDGIEVGSVVAVGMIGCKRNKRRFLDGYNAMMEKIHPEAVICFGRALPEMLGHMINVDYLSSRKVER